MKDHDKYGKSLVQLSRILMGVGIIISAVLIIVSVRDAHENLLYASVITMVGSIILCKLLEAAGHGIILMHEQNENSKRMIDMLEKQILVLKMNLNFLLGQTKLAKMLFPQMN